MVLDAGRIKHRGDLMHKSIASNGSAVPSNWRLSADGLTNVVWTPETTGGSVSYGSNSNDVGNASDPGAANLSSRADHVHKGVRSVAHSSNTLFGDIELQTEGSLYIVKPAGNILKLGSTGSGGGGGTTITTKDEGSTLSTGVTTLDFVGAGVTASGAGATTTVTIPGGGGSTNNVVQVKYAGTAISSITLHTAPASGHSVLLYCDAFNTADPTAVSSTNTTWTKIKSTTGGGGAKYSLWVGVVAGGAGGTAITITHANSFLSAFAIEVTDTLTPTLGTSAAGANNTVLETAAAPANGSLVAMFGGVDNTGLQDQVGDMSIPSIGLKCGVVFGMVGYSTGSIVSGRMQQQTGAAVICEIT